MQNRHCPWELASFVLKPVNPEELTEELIKCKEKLEKIHHQNNSFQKMREEINQHQKEQYLLERLSGIGGMEKEERIRQILGIRKPVCYVVLLLRFRDKEGKGKTAGRNWGYDAGLFPRV